MNPGTLDRKIQIQRQAPGLFLVTASGEYLLTAAGERMTTSSRKGRFGAELDAWGLWKTRMAARIKSKGREREANARERATASVTFRLRYTAGLSAADRLVDTRDGQAYDIEDWDGDGRQGWMEIYCTRHRTPENENAAV